MLLGMYLAKNKGEYSHAKNNEDKMGNAERVEMQ